MLHFYLVMKPWLAFFLWYSLTLSGATLVGTLNRDTNMISAMPYDRAVSDEFAVQSSSHAPSVVSDVRFDPETIWQLKEDDITSVTVTVILPSNYSQESTTYIHNRFLDNDNVSMSNKMMVFNVVSRHPDIALIHENPFMYLEWDDILLGKNYTFRVQGIFLGHAEIFWTLREFFPNHVSVVNYTLNQDELQSATSHVNKALLSGDIYYLSGVYHVSVIQKSSTFKTVFTIVISILISINNINMGCHLHLDVIKKVLKKPVAPTIGFCSQFLFMPLASYGFGLLFIKDKLSWRLGLFTLGCSPGGTMSNFWTLIFDGDLDLSVTMTFVSTIAALGMMPLWMFTLGSSLLQDTSVQVPFMNMILSLLGLTIPLAIGVAIQHWRPRWAEKGRRILRPFTLFCIVVGVGVGVYSSLYVFQLFDWSVVGAGASIAWGGYVFGGLFAFIFRLNKAQIIAVSIETALQNAGVAFVLLIISLEQPDADLAAVPLVAQLLVTGVTLWTTYLVYCSFHRITKKKAKEVDMMHSSVSSKKEVKVDIVTSV